MTDEFIATLVSTITANIGTIIACILTIIRVIKNANSDTAKQLKESREQIADMKDLVLAQQQQINSLSANLEREQKRRLRIKEED